MRVWAFDARVGTDSLRCLVHIPESVGGADWAGMVVRGDTAVVAAYAR